MVSLIREARKGDISRLVELENACFISDRLSKKSFAHIIVEGNALTLVDEEERRLRGYVMLLFREGTSMARLYSIAVALESRGKGVAKGLIVEAERRALEEGCISIRLEVRVDNIPSISLFNRLGYREFGVYLDYYEDHMGALRLEKRLNPQFGTEMTKVPFYGQSLDFTCGASSLMMAMKALDDSLSLDRWLELEIWRESTTVFMTSGPAGCSPYGLAVCARMRGFKAEILVRDDGVFLIDSVRSEAKKEVIRLVQQGFLRKVKELGIPLRYQRLRMRDIKRIMESGGVPIVLISSYRIYREKVPHWVVVTGCDDRFIYVHDPYVDTEMGMTVTDCVNMPIPRSAFETMSKYGRSGQRAVVIVRKDEK